MLMVALLMVLALGLMGLSTIELRRSSREEHTAAARANARLALVSAIGQLQKTLGPDQRVSATAEILGDGVKQPHWTGVWRTRQADGSSWFTRDDLAGGLHDGRTAGSREKALVWLTSGEGDPMAGPTGDAISLISAGANGQADPVTVPLMKVGGKGKATGSYAWWTGDLGVRANIATTDPRAGTVASRENPSDGGMYRMLASAAPDLTMMGLAEKLEKSDGDRLVTEKTTALTAAGRQWTRDHGFDFTVASSGVLADVAEGGLKRDLTAYLVGDGTVPDLHGRPGLKDDDSLVGEPRSGATGSAAGLSASASAGEDSRHRQAGPRFGLLRNWAREAVSFADGKTKAREPQTTSGDTAVSRDKALANETPVKLAGNLHADLQPIIVEASNFTQISSYQLEQTPGASKQYQLRHLLYPRVVLWNPYNVEIETERSIVMIQGNGRQEMWTQNSHLNGAFTSTSQWLSFEGGRSTNFNGTGLAVLETEGYKDQYLGSYYFSIPATRFSPGECLVFSPAKSAEYDCLTPYNNRTSYNLAANELSCEVAPDPSRCYYVSGSDIGGGITYLPTLFWYAPTPYWSQAGRNGVENQGDDTRAILKSIGPENSTVSFQAFDALPQLSVLSASLQFGAGREPRIAWNSFERMPVQLLDRQAPRPTVVPNVRTREGIRLRWFTEHPSNRLGSGALASTAHFDDAVLANFNPRASFIVRSPWDNVAGSMPGSGSAGGPWFFGAYTRDLFDQAVSWDEQAPVPRNGRYHGNPFGPPQEGAERYILFDLPRHETGVVSLAQFQHAKISELVWHPSFAVANSLADPRLGTGVNAGLNRTAATAFDKTSAGFGGFHENDIGWSSDSQRALNKGDWAATARAILGDVPKTDNLVYDLSFEVNQSMWDRYFLSSGTAQEKVKFRDDPLKHPLPNSRLRPVAGTPPELASLTDFHRAASQLMVDGAFNVNSTRVDAWKALLGSSKLTGYGTGGTPFPRVLDAPGGAWKEGDEAWDDKAWSGYRELNDEEVGKLAEAIVHQVKLRGPFLSLADFVNRRLAEDETGRMGPLQAAIESAGLNAAHVDAYPLDNLESLPDYRHPDNLRDATRLEQTLKPASKAWGAPTYLTQADVLQVIGPALAARSDSFVIRAYGDSLDEAGKVQARAWCEATVQRLPEPVMADESGLDPKGAGQPGDFGRRFVIASFRWLSPEEI